MNIKKANLKHFREHIYLMMDRDVVTAFVPYYLIAMDSEGQNMVVVKAYYSQLGIKSIKKLKKEDREKTKDKILNEFIKSLRGESKIRDTRLVPFFRINEGVHYNLLKKAEDVWSWKQIVGISPFYLREGGVHERL